ncbi:molybdopterin converting factor subunit 1 [Bacillus taeanensis]|uniref:Molybdopterin synthase sulfur carrier subunit n=1 Tax=Bacillus taeanensis TaxID=273032 RepID=A0A366XT27_9BACI|nr:molybdopterin converting factor subunit 1 [Bacillus taeanensis]RBW69530.1 molybdopterin converting factor subunit 1 [Bacillus taeanensis]
MITILFFAGHQETIGKEQIEWNKAGVTISELKRDLQEKYPALTLDQSMAAVNEEYAADDTMVNDSDIVAFIPPVSGG